MVTIGGTAVEASQLTRACAMLQLTTTSRPLLTVELADPPRAAGNGHKRMNDLRKARAVADLRLTRSFGGDRGRPSRRVSCVSLACAMLQLTATSPPLLTAELAVPLRAAGNGHERMNALTKAYAVTDLRLTVTPLWWRSGTAVEATQLSLACVRCYS